MRPEKGYRNLKVGELVKQGDEFSERGPVPFWTEVEQDSTYPVGHHSHDGKRFRRKI